ncbi:MAG TPA: nitrous oxide-stimulated promoter family protein [Thermoplasmata archaeon]|jgi:hypothetical protein
MIAGSRRLQREKKTAEVMIRMYCRAHHGRQSGLCDECRQLGEYASRQVDGCPFGAAKPTCLNCAVHCYEESKRASIRTIMRYSGPRMLLRHPYLAVMHISDGRSGTPRKD